MNERFGQYRLPNIIAPGAEPPSREGPKTFLSAEDISAQDHILKTRHDASRQGSDQTSHFRSRVNGWVRAVALAIALVFVPEKAGWGLNYNQLVLWGNKAGDRGQGTGFSGRREFRPTSKMERREGQTRDRKSVVQGKSVDLGGRRIIKKR